jgi:glyoxylase-like metal-dependent hydrolase (beta-lactamase superfamily II)
VTQSLRAEPGERPFVDVGHIRVTALLDGVGDIEPITEAFPDAPAEALLAYRERYPGVYGESDAWRLRIRAWLIRSPQALILVDTGIGVEGAPGPKWFGATGRLMEEVRAEGISPADIDLVVITHVHDDHLGGTVTVGGDPAFPAARYVVQTADLAWQRASAAENDEERASWNTLLQPLMDKGIVQEVDGTVALTPGIEVQLFPGHTPGHQVVRVSDEARRLVISGDAFTHPMQLSHPDWANESDDTPAIADTSRRKLIAELGSHPGMVLAPTHFAEPFGRMTFGPDHLAGWNAV